MGTSLWSRIIKFSLASFSASPAYRQTTSTQYCGQHSSIVGDSSIGGDSSRSSSSRKKPRKSCQTVVFCCCVWQPVRQQSKHMCRSQRRTFDGKDLLHDLLGHLIFHHCHAHHHRMNVSSLSESRRREDASSRTRWRLARHGPEPTSIARAIQTHCEHAAGQSQNNKNSYSRLVLLLMRCTTAATSALGSADLSTCSLSSASACLSANNPCRCSSTFSSLDVIPIFVQTLSTPSPSQNWKKRAF